MAASRSVAYGQDMQSAQYVTHGPSYATSGPVSTGMGDPSSEAQTVSVGSVHSQPPRPTQPPIPRGTENEYRSKCGRDKHIELVPRIGYAVIVI